MDRPIGLDSALGLDPMVCGHQPVERPSLLSNLTRSHIDKLSYSMDDLLKLLHMKNESELRSVYLGQGLMQLVE